MVNKIQLRRDTAANWTAANPILSAGEPGLETDTNQRKVGDGTATWVNLRYDSAATKLINSPTPMARVVNVLGSRQIKGYDPIDHIAWYQNSTNLVTSADHGVTMGSDRTLPTNVTAVNVIKVLRAGGYVWLGAKDTTDNLAKVWRAPVTSGAYTWSGPLVSMSANGGLLMSGMGADDQYIYVGDYADPTGGAKVYRGDVATGTFTNVTPTGIVRHVHAITPDPYNAGHVWMTTGDSGPRIYRSTNYGATWTLLDSTWQAVQISFSKDWVYFAADSAVVSAFVMDRTKLVPMAVTPSFHYEMPVPGGVGGRKVTDLATTNASATVTSATAAFTSDDVGKSIFPANHGSFDIYITAVGSSTSATMSINHYATATGVAANIGGDRYYDKAFWGAVDPATGIYYCVANDNSGKGNRSGLFMLPKTGASLELIQTFPVQITGEMFLADGYLHTHQIVRPLLTTANA